MGIQCAGMPKQKLAIQIVNKHLQQPDLHICTSEYFRNHQLSSSLRRQHLQQRTIIISLHSHTRRLHKWVRYETVPLSSSNRLHIRFATYKYSMRDIYIQHFTLRPYRPASFFSLQLFCWATKTFSQEF